MKLLMLCGYFAKNNEEEVIRHTKASAQFSANEFQRKLISGFRGRYGELEVISAPFIGSYPKQSDIVYFRGFENPQEECRYVHFSNVWGWRNLSRARGLKKAVKHFALSEEKDKLIVVYCPHTPFLEAAAYAKQLDPGIKVCFYVPDLPNYMNLDADRSKLYDFAKSFDIAAMKRHLKCVDAYVLLTEPMISALGAGDKPCMVAEGIIDTAAQTDAPAADPETAKTYIVYTGKLNEKFGVADLLEGFSRIPDPDCSLVLCGIGDCMEKAEQAARKDPRILLTGLISPEEARRWQKRAAVLVNPRQNNETYTKYSFPSKIIEYLLTGNPVAAFMLDGMPEIYRQFLYEADPNLPPAQAIADAILRAIRGGQAKEKHEAFLEYAQEHLLADKIAGRMVRLAFQTEEIS